MIKSFTHKGLENLFYDGTTRGIQTKYSEKLSDILDIIDTSINIKDINFPGSGLHRLKGKMKDFWAIKVSGNWRVVFIFKESNAYKVDYLDYH